MRTLLLTLSVLFLLPNFFNINLEKTPQYDHKEKFDPSLSYINSVDKLIHVADCIAINNNITQSSLHYAILVATILRYRFYHGFSQYKLSQNWIAALGEHCMGCGLASLVNPDEILKYSYGGCSQQSLVLMEVMKRKNISYRSVGFPHHYAVELNIHNNWYFFDTNMEPNMADSDRLEGRWNSSADSLKKYYDHSHYTDLDWKFGKSLFVTHGKVNADPAPHAKIFQSATYYLSRLLWLCPLLIVLYPKRKPVNSFNPINQDYTEYSFQY